MNGVFPLTIRHLQIFIAVADTGTMSLAAKQLYISQPTVSQVISEMESSYGVRLFERLSRRLYITDTGKQLLKYARHIVASFEEMERGLHDASEHPILRIGATITVGSCILTGIIRRFETKSPQIQVQAYVDNTRSIVKMILESELDLALVEGVVSEEDIVVQAMIDDELVLVCGMQHPFAKKQGCIAEELQGQAFILREEGSGTRARFEGYLNAHGVEIFPKWVCHSSDSILKAVEGGQGLSVLSKLLAEPSIRSGKLHQISLSDARLTRFFSLIYHKNKFLSEPLLQLIKEIPQTAHTGS